MKSPAVKSLAVVVVLLAAMTWAKARSTANVVEGAQYAATSSVVEVVAAVALIYRRARRPDGDRLYQTVIAGVG